MVLRGDFMPKNGQKPPQWWKNEQREKIEEKWVAANPNLFLRIRNFFKLVL
jgi:hypothetical protein